MVAIVSGTILHSLSVMQQFLQKLVTGIVILNTIRRNADSMVVIVVTVKINI